MSTWLPALERNARPQFLRGDFETAAFVATKEGRCGRGVQKSRLHWACRKQRGEKRCTNLTRDITRGTLSARACGRRERPGAGRGASPA
jgi:hypothetical protein